MKSKISALMDGELGAREAGEPLAALASDREARETWRTYHLISDTLRDTRLASPGFAERVNARVLEEPTVLSRSRDAASSFSAAWARAHASAMPVSAMRASSDASQAPSRAAPGAVRSRIRSRAACS